MGCANIWLLHAREYDDLNRDALKKAEEIHMARVYGIRHAKQSEPPIEGKRRKVKGRGRLLGNQLKNQHSEAAFFKIWQFTCFVWHL